MPIMLELNQTELSEMETNVHVFTNTCKGLAMTASFSASVLVAASNTAAQWDFFRSRPVDISGCMQTKVSRADQRKLHHTLTGFGRVTDSIRQQDPTVFSASFWSPMLDLGTKRASSPEALCEGSTCLYSMIWLDSLCVTEQDME